MSNELVMFLIGGLKATAVILGGGALCVVVSAAICDVEARKQRALRRFRR